MKALIADWGKNCNGERYTLFIVQGISKEECFWKIDEKGDPSNVKYRLFDMDYIMSEGIETQEEIKHYYETAEKSYCESLDGDNIPYKTSKGTINLENPDDATEYGVREYNFNGLIDEIYENTFNKK